MSKRPRPTRAAARRRARGPGLALLLLLLVPLLAAGAPRPATAAEPPAAALEPPSSSTYDAFTQFARFLETVLTHYAAPQQLASLNQHTTAALRAFLRSLDPQADLFTAAEAAARSQPPGPDTLPFGARLAVVDDTPTVVATHAGSPAQVAGLLPGERIVAINDQPTTGKRLFEVGRDLDGKPGSQCILRVLTPGHGTRSIVVTRTPPPAPPAASRQALSRTVTYLRLPEFSFAVTEGLLHHLNTFREQRGRALIIDLRNNPGGPLDATVMAASFFLPAKTEIVSLLTPQEGRAAPFVSSHPQPLNFPVVLLVNGATAAEAEVFAAALRDNGAARLVGTKTAGRGRQSADFNLPDGSVIHLPVAEYRTPHGARLQDQGLAPDEVVELPLETERRLTGVGFGNFRWSADPRQILATDQQLARALERANQQSP